MADRRKDLPPANSAQFLQQVREAVSTYLGNRGDKLDRGVTVRDLVDSGLVELNAGFLRGTGGAPIKGPGPNVGTGGGGGGTTPYEPDLSPPPTPSGVTVTAGIDFLMFVTDPPLYLQGHGHGRTRVYGTTWTSGPKPTFADAKELMQFLGNVDSYPTNPATKWHIWLKWVTNDGIASAVPAGGTNGFEVTTGQDVSQLLSALQGKLRNEQLDPASNFRFKANLFTIESTAGSPSINPFTVITAPTLTPAGELLPVGVYMEAAYIKGLEAALARFQTAIITNAMIVSVSASRITSGVINVGSYIQSSNYVAGTTGWRIHGDGTAEFPAAVIRGKLVASQIDGRGLQVLDNDGSVIIGAGTSLDWSKIGAAKPRTIVASSAGYTSSPPLGRGVWVDGTPITTYDGYFWKICILHPTTLALVDSYRFLGNGTLPEYTSDGAAAFLQNWVNNSNYPVVVVTNDNPFSSLTDSLRNVLYKCGASRGGLAAAYGFRASYALIGRCNAPEGSGTEQYNAVADTYAMASATWMGGALVSGQKDVRIDATNVSTYIANAAINAAQIGSLSVGVMSTGLNGGAASGERMVMALNQLFAYDVNNVDRALFGRLS